MRRFRDQDGVEWEAEAVPAQSEIQPGQETPMMDEVGWRVRFRAQDPPADRIHKARGTFSLGRWATLLR